MKKSNCNCVKCGVALWRKPSRLIKYATQYCPSCDYGVDHSLHPNAENQAWKDVPEFQGILQISNFGNAKTFDRVRSDNRIERGKTCSQKVKKNGYLEISIRNGEKKRWFLMHRLVAKLFLEETSETQCVNHKNGNKKDNRVENLEFTTFKENSNHAVRTGLCKNEEIHYKAKLTKLNVIEIRNSVESNEELALKFGVSKSTIKYVKQRKTWKYV
jgi:hypothetical protein